MNAYGLILISGGEIVRNSGKKKWIIFLTALLAALCVGLVELSASYFFAPDVYQYVTAPVRRFCRAAADLGERAASALSAASAQAMEEAARAAGEAAQWWEDLTAKPEEEEIVEEQQLASDPVVVLEAPILDPAVTELVEREEGEVLTGGIMPIVYYNQSEEPWADQPYGRDDIGRYGCGPTAMCMVVSSMTDTKIDPAQMAKWAVEHGCWASRSGSYLSIVERTAQGFGLTARPISEKTPEAVQAALLEGNLLVALMGPGHFTKGGHFILLRGVTLTGTILVADPNSLERSLLEWEPQMILDELSRSTANGAPLWVISKNAEDT